MSVRPQQVADEASRFSLRSVFSGLTPARHAGDAAGVFAESDLPPSPTAAVPASPPLAAVPGLAPATTPSSGGLRFDLPLGTAATAPPAAPQAAPMPLLGLSAAGGGGKKFSFQLPQLQGSATGSATGDSDFASAARFAAAAAGGAPGEGQKMLRAGYLSGGCAVGASAGPEVMRLNAVVDDLQTKLRKNAERLATTEQSVARGNAALQSERATSHARIVALAGEVKQAQLREAQVRAEMAALPKVSDYDKQKFEMQARGAVELEAKYDDEVARASALEEVLHGLRATHEAQTAEHQALQTRLADATEQLEAALMDALAAREETRVATAAAEAATAAAAEAAPATAAAAAPEAPPAPQVSLETVTAAVAASLAARAEDMVPRIDQEEHVAIVGQLQAELADTRRALAEAQAIAEAETTKSAEADMLIKQLDLKLATVREEARAAQPTAHCGEDHRVKGDDEDDSEDEDVPLPSGRRPSGQGDAGGWPSTTDNPSGGGRSNNTKECCEDAAIVAQFDRYYELKKAAHAAAERAQGTDAGAAAVAEARDKIGLAQRAFAALSTGQPQAPMAFACVVCADDDEPELAPEAVHCDLAAFFEPRLDDVKTRLAVGGPDFDCPIALHGHRHSPLCDAKTTGGALQMSSHTAEAVSLKMRTDSYVTAVSKDIKTRLRLQKEAWQLKATGAKPAPEAAAAPVAAEE